MATRERKTRNTTESPTPSSGNDSTPVTPTQKSSVSLRGRGRGRNRVSRSTGVDKDDSESVQSNEDEPTGKLTPQRSSSRMSAAASKEDEDNKFEDTKSEKTSPSRTAKTVTRSSRVTEETITKRIVRSNSDLVQRNSLHKRKSLPVTGTRNIARKRGVGGRPVGSTKSLHNAKDEKQKLRSGRPRNKVEEDQDKKQTDENVFKKPAKVENVEVESMSDSEVSNLRRRRSTSKSSDTTGSNNDISETDQKAPVIEDTIKKEIIEVEKPSEDSNKKQDILDKMAQNFSEAKMSELEISQIRRSGRPRKSTCKEKEETIKQVEIKKETKALVESSVEEEEIKVTKEPLEISTHNDKALDVPEKDSSLSPQLVSEGVSEISVKTFYGEPAFLENNLGIEKDPKLGEIVQVQGKITAEIVEPKEQIAFKQADEAIDVTESKRASIAPVLDSDTIKEATDETLMEISNSNIDNSNIENVDKDTEKSKPISQKTDNDNNVEVEESKLDSVTEVTDDNKENSLNECKEIGAKNEEIPLDVEPDPVIKDQNSIAIPEDSESPELLKEKEKHLLSLGLLTHEAAVEAAKEKRKRRELLQRFPKAEKRNKSGEYTGTLKTIIKLNRTSPEKRKTRMPLKMTFQKGKGKITSEKDLNGSSVSEEKLFYTIHQEKQVDQQQENVFNEKSRKGHNRSHNEIIPSKEIDDSNKETEKELVIPEKASSFKVHPGRLCLDQCFYCGGKFGLYDTPCHIAQIKLVERQDKILKSEEKLTRDSCLCDACFRHVDRKANCPSYRKRLVANASNAFNEGNRNVGMNSQNESVRQLVEAHTGNQETGKDYDNTCCVLNCTEPVAHTLRKKWISKTKKQVSKIIELDNDMINNALTLIPICDTHYQSINHLMICAMCKRRLPKNHIFYIAQDISRLEYLIFNQGIPMKLGHTALIVCKLCRYYANLLLRPTDDRPQKLTFIKNYSKRLLQLFNSEPEDVAEFNQEESSASNADDKIVMSISMQKQTAKLREMRKPKRSTEMGQTRDGTHPDEPEISIIPSKPCGPNSSVHTAGHILLDNDVMVDYDTPLVEHRIHKQNSKINKNQSLLLPRSLPGKEKDMTKALKSNPNISMRELFPGEEEMNLHINLPFNVSATRTPEGWARVQTTIQYDDQTRSLWEELQKPYGNQSSFIKHLILLEKYFRNGDLVLSQNASSSAVTYSESVQNRLRSYDSSINNKLSDSSLNILQQLSNAPITITPTTKIKSKVLSVDGGHKNPPNAQPNESMKRKLGALEKFSSTKMRQGISQPPSKQIKIDDQQKASAPPDLISINTSQSQKPLASPQKKLPADTPMQEQVVKLPDTLTPSERKQTAKPWRPTLIPITPGSSAIINSGTLYQTADGRKLPGLVQVMSGGKPYHISIHDYNRMCILRREKLWQLQQQQQQHIQQQQQQKDNNISQPQNSQPVQKPSTPPTTNSDIANKPKPMVQIPNQILEQNSFIPILSNSNKSSNNMNESKMKKTGNSLLKNLVPIAPKLPNSTSLLKISTTTPNKHNDSKETTQSVGPVLSVANILSQANTVNSGNGITASGTSAIDALIKSQMQNQLWLWGESIGLNVNNPAANIANSGGSILIDNSVLSKIPKSLTVIPQQRSRPSEGIQDDNASAGKD